MMRENAVLLPNSTYLPPISPYSTLNFISVLKSLFYLRTVIRRNKIDIIHIMYAEPGALWGNWRLIFNVPVLLTTRGTDILKTINSFSIKKDFLSRIVMKQYKSAFKKFHIITCTSISQSVKINEWVPSAPTCLIRTGVDLRILYKKKINRVGQLKPIVLFPRSMYPMYNHELALMAIKLLPTIYSEKWKFVFLNEDSKDQVYVSKIKKIADSLELDIQFLPNLRKDELYHLIGQSQVVVMTPLSDGSPVSAMETMALRVPIILPPLHYDEDVFGKGIFRFDKYEPLVLAKKIIEVMTMDSEQKEKLVRIACDNVLKKANFEVEMGKILNLYHEMLAKVN